MTPTKCAPCLGTGKRHSIFDDCQCEPECVELGVCSACDGTGVTRPPAPCVVCREVAPVDGAGWCYPCFEDAMFAEDSDMADMGVDA